MSIDGSKHSQQFDDSKWLPLMLITQIQQIYDPIAQSSNREIWMDCKYEFSRNRVEKGNVIIASFRDLYSQGNEFFQNNVDQHNIFWCNAKENLYRKPPTIYASIYLFDERNWFHSVAMYGHQEH